MSILNCYRTHRTFGWWHTSVIICMIEGRKGKARWKNNCITFSLASIGFNQCSNQELQSREFSIHDIVTNSKCRSYLIKHDWYIFLLVMRWSEYFVLWLALDIWLLINGITLHMATTLFRQMWGGWVSNNCGGINMAWKNFNIQAVPSCETPSLFKPLKLRMFKALSCRYKLVLKFL